MAISCSVLAMTTPFRDPEDLNDTRTPVDGLCISCAYEASPGNPPAQNTRNPVVYFRCLLGTGPGI
jgi:hypothetical protein